MIRAFVVWLFVFSIVSLLIFGYRQIRGSDVKVAGKLTLAGIITAVLVTVIFVLETGN